MPRVNACPNPSCAVDTTGWRSAGSATRITGLSGTPRATGVRVTFPGGNYTEYLGAAEAPAAAGQTWSGVVWVRASAARSVTVTLATWNSGTFAGTVGAVTVALAANTWTQVQVTAALSGTFTHVAANVDGSSGWAAADTLDVSSCRIEQVSDPALTYADGATSGWQWDGTAGASTSQEAVKPYLVDTYPAEAANSPTTLTTASFTPAAGEVLVAKVTAGDETTVLGTVTGGGLTWAQINAVAPTNYCPAKLFTAVVGGSPSAMTVSVPTTGTQTGSSPTLIVERWASASLDATPATDTTFRTGAEGSGNPVGTPAATLTPDGAGGVLTWFTADWQSVAGATVTYRTTSAAPVENYRRRVTSSINVFSAYQDVTGTGAQTYGMAAPTGQRWTMLAVELRPASTTGPPVVQGAAALAGGGSLTAGALQGRAAAATARGAGSLTAGAWQGRQAAAALAGGGSLTAGSAPVRPAAADLRGAGRLTGAGRGTAAAEALLQGAGSLEAQPGAQGAATLRAAASLTAGPEQDHASEALLQAAGSLTADGWQTHDTAAALAAAGALTADGFRDQPADALLQGAGTLTTDGTIVKTGAAPLRGAGTLDIGDVLRTAVVAAPLRAAARLTATAAVATGGGLNLSAWAVDRQQGGTLVPLPGVVSGDISDVANDAGAITITHLRDGSRGDQLLRRDVGDDSDLEIEIWVGGRRSTALRGYLEDVAGDDVAENGTGTYTGRLMLMRLEQAVIAPQPADEKREYRVAAATPGAMALQLLAQAKARGVLTDITTDFTSTHDSEGTPWPELFTGSWSPGTTYLEWVQSLVDFVLCETELTSNKVWRLFVFGGRGDSLTSGLHPVTLRRGLNVGEAGRRATVRGAGTDFLVAGGEGIYRTEVVPNARARRGRAVEVASSVGNIDEQGAVIAAAQRVAASGTSGAEERSFALALTAGQPRPVQTFTVGDTLRVDTDGSLTSERVAQWQLAWDSSGITGAATTGDLIRSRMAGLLKRLTAVGSGTAIIGTSERTEDTGIPLAPTGLVVGSAAYAEGLDIYSAVTAGWLAVQSNVDGTAATDLDRYRVEWCLESAQDVWLFGAEVAHPDTDASWTVSPGLPIRVRVQAIDRAGNRSAWSNQVLHLTEDDATPPPVSSAPVVENWMGALRITWDGLSSAGLDMPAAAPDFSHVELHLSTASNFTPNPAAGGTLVTNLYARGTWTIGNLPIGVTQYARLVSVDIRGNRQSTPSVQGSAAPRQLLGPEIFDGAVGSAKLASLAVKNANIDVGAVNTLKVSDLSVAVLTGGIATFDVTLAGIIRTALTGARTEQDNAGIRLYDSANQIRVNLATATGNALVTGEYRTALSGARLVLNPGGSSPAEQRFYPSSTNQYARMKPVTSVAIGYENQGGINGKAYSARSDGQSGEINVFPGLASLVWGNEEAGGAITSRVAASAPEVFVGGPRVRIVANVGGDDTLSAFQFDAAGNYGYGRMMVLANNAGWQFNRANPYNSISAINNANNLIVIFGSGFLTSSDKSLKSQVERDPFDPVAAVKRAPFYRYELDDGRVDKAGKKRRSKEIGLMAEDLPPDLVELDHNGKQAVNVYGVTSVLWGAVQALAAKVEQLERRPPR